MKARSFDNPVSPVLRPGHTPKSNGGASLMRLARRGKPSQGQSGRRLGPSALDRKNRIGLGAPVHIAGKTGLTLLLPGYIIPTKTSPR